MTLESPKNWNSPPNENRAAHPGLPLGHWLFVWLGAVAAGGLFGLLAVDFGGLVLGVIIAGVFGVPVVLTFVVLTWALWLPRFSIAVAALAGACIGLLSMAIIPLPLFFLSFAASFVLAACFGAIGSGISANLYSKKLRVTSASNEHAANFVWRFSPRDLMLRSTVVSAAIAIWTLGISTYQERYSFRRGPSGSALLSSGYELIPEAKQIDDHFGHAWHFTANFQDPSTVQWFSEAIVGGRYELTMVADIWYDEHGATRALGAPTFALREISDVDGRSVSYGKSYEFSAGEWRKVTAANGDFSVIGIKLDLNNPAPGIDEYRKMRLEQHPKEWPKSAD